MKKLLFVLTMLAAMQAQNSYCMNKIMLIMTFATQMNIWNSILTPNIHSTHDMGNSTEYATPYPDPKIGAKNYKKIEILELCDLLIPRKNQNGIKEEYQPANAEHNPYIYLSQEKIISLQETRKNIKEVHQKMKKICDAALGYEAY